MEPSEDRHPHEESAKNSASARASIDEILDELASLALTKSHARHISLTRAQNLGIKVVRLEGNDALQEARRSVHHVFIQTLSDTPAIKIIEDQKGIAYIQQVTP